MQNNHPQSSLDTQAQRSSGKALPPLSKYYYGPSQTWSATDNSSIHQRNSALGASDGYEPPTSQPQRLSSTPSTYSLNQMVARPSPSTNSPQPWQVPGPPPSAPPASQIASNPYNPSAYGLMPSARQSPVNPNWNQSTSSLNSDTSRRGMNYNHQHTPDLAQVPKPALPARSYDSYNGFHGQSQLHGPPDSQFSNSAASQTGQVPEFLKPVAYSPNYTPQFEIDLYKTPSYQKATTAVQPQNEQQSSLPPHIPPPRPPKLPQSYSNIGHSDQEDAQEHAPYYTKRESRQNSETSLDKELRQYQQYSEKLHQFGDSSAASLSSNKQQKGEHRRNASQAESYPSSSPTRFKDSSYRSNQQDRRIVKMPLATNKGNQSDLPQHKEDYKTADVSSPRLENKPRDDFPKHDASAANQKPATDSLKSSDLSTVSTHQDKHSNEQKLMQSHSTQVTNMNENNRQGADPYRQSGRSLKLSSSNSDTGIQLLSEATKPSNPIIDRFNSKISSATSDQRYSEPLMKPPEISQTAIAHYSSSALGLGGPSDWEHFGDYDVEEVDDTALYSRIEPKITTDMAPNAAELPVETSPTDDGKLSNQQSLADSTPVPQNTEPWSTSQNLQISSPDTAGVSESSVVEKKTLDQPPSRTGNPANDETSFLGRPSPPSRSPPAAPSKPVENPETPRNDGVDDVTTQSNTISVSNDNTPKGPIDPSDTSSQASQTKDYRSQTSTPVKFAQDKPEEVDDKPNITFREKENSIEYTDTGAVNQAEMFSTPKNSPLEREVSRDESKPTPNVDTVTTVPPTEFQDEIQPALESGEVSPVTGKATAMLMITSNPGRPQIKPVFQERRKQFRKNSLQFQEKLKRFQPTTDQPRESPMISQKRPNHSQEILSPHQRTLERSEDRLEKPQLDHHQENKLQHKPGQQQQQREHIGLKQNGQEKYPGNFDQPQHGPRFGQPTQPIEELPKPKRSQDQIEQLNQKRTSQSSLHQSESSRGKHLLEYPKLEQFESDLSNLEQFEAEPPQMEPPEVEPPQLEPPQLEQPKFEQPKNEQSILEQPKLEQPKLKQPKLEQPKLEQPKLEQPELGQSKLEQPNLEQPNLEQPKLEHSKLEQPKLEQPELEQSKLNITRLELPKLEQPLLEQQTMLQQIMQQYPWAKQPQIEQVKQYKEATPQQPYDEPKDDHESERPSEIVSINQQPKEPKEDPVSSGGGPEHHEEKSNHNEEAYTEEYREKPAEPILSQELSHDHMKHVQEGTWLDLSGSGDMEPKLPLTSIPAEKSHKSAISETLPIASSQSDILDESEYQVAAGKPLTPPKHLIDSLPKSANSHPDRGRISDTSNTDELVETVEVESRPPSQEPSPDDMPKSSSSGTHNIAPGKDDGVSVLYTDLDPWGRASLNRYISMLNEEAKAETDKEKLSIFTIFINRESKLRAVLYGADDELSPVQQNILKNSPQQPLRTSTKSSQKALPALPPIETPQLPQTFGGSNENFTSPSGQAVPKLNSIGLHDELNQDQPSHLKSLKADSPADETQYSPGGRPIVQREQIVEEKPKNSSTKLKTQRDKVNKVLTQFTHYMYPSTSPSSDAPIVVKPGDTPEPPKPSTKPLKSNERKAEPIDYLSKRQSAYRPYAALTMGSLDKALVAPQESTFKPSNTAETPGTITRDEHRQAKQNVENNEKPQQVTINVARNQTDTSHPQDLRRFVQSDFDSLVSVLPSSATVRPESIELRDMKAAMDTVPDDFSFIHQSVVAWDAVAKKEREVHERARHARQGESERRFDELFNDHEIGYGDISELESEFKRSEAAKKADEDRLEYQTFLSSVFDIVWARLHREIDDLTPLYDEYTRIINDTLVGKDMFDQSTASFALAPTMSCLLALHQKLEIRHQKAFEAVLERDRRLKKTEVSPWYTIGNVTKVKQLEKQFESAEKNAIVEYCTQRDIRANKLMDVLDQNTLRGVGVNQDYMECLMNGVRRVASGRAFASMPSSESGLGLSEVTKAKSVTAILASSSEQIVQTFHVADMLLNEADYEASVAKSKLINADAETFKRLKDERSKEDQKLVRDLEHRLALIREDSRRTHDEIVKLMLFLGIQNGHAETQQPVPSPPDPAHEERIQKALIEAKRRNESEKDHGT